MASIKSQMALNDGMSAVLKKITKALDTTLAGFEQVQAASGQAIDDKLLRAAHVELAQANNEIDRMEASFKQAQQREESFNSSLRAGTSAADGLLTKIASIAAAYLSLSSIKNLVTDSLGAADTQINAQVQLRTVLENMGTMDSFEPLEGILSVDTTGALSEYQSLVAGVDGTELDNTLALDTAGALSTYESFSGSVDGAVLTGTMTLDTTGAMTAYDAIIAKASDIQSRGIYGDEAMIAGAAELATYFSDANAILSMMDTLSNYAMGMSGGGELDTTAMVDYATGIGKIMTGSYDAMTKKGFEFSEVQKAIIEGTATNAQIAEELGAEYVNMSNDMQAAAVINDIIGESWDGLYEAMSRTPEGQIIQFNNALGDVKETIGAGIYPAVLDFMSVFQENLPQVQELALNFASTLGLIISFLTSMANGALEFAGFVQDNWSVISPIVWGIVAALTAYAVISAAVAIANGIHAASEATKAAAQAMATGTTFAETAAQYGLNAALMACPITWIVLGVLAFIVALVALCNWIAKTTGAAQTGFGVITGGINVAVQAVKMGLTVADLAVVNFGMLVANIGLGIWSALGAVCSNIGTAFHNVIANVQGWFYGLLSTALTVVEGICAALNKLPFVEFDFSGITAKADEYAAKSAEAYGSVEDYTSVADAFNSGMNTFDAFGEGWMSDNFSAGWATDAFQAGAAWGDGVADKIGGAFDFDLGTLDGYANDAAGLPADLGSIAGDTGDIAGSAKGIADKLDVSTEVLEYLRDIAERDAINRFTTAEVKIDMTGMTNRIEGEADLDGVLSTLTDGFAEALVVAAEGVHA